MRGQVWWTFILLTIALGASLPGAEETAQTKSDSPAAQDETPKSKVVPVAGQDTSKETRKPPLSLDMLKAPGGAILILYEETREALRLLPKAVVLSPDKYQELLDQLEQLRRQLKPDKAQTPSVCKLTGRVEGEIVRLRAQYEFKTERPQATVALGGKRAWAVAATLGDGQLPAFQPLADEGYVALLEKPGVHQLTLELAVPVQARGGDRGFDLDLPRAAITILEQFDLPATVAEVRVGTRTQRTKPSGISGIHRLEAIPLGPVERLEMTWKGPAVAQKKVPTTLMARGRLAVRVEDALVLTEADLTLQALSGATAAWRIQVPPAVALERVQVLPGTATGPPEKLTGQDERVEGIDYPTETNPVLTVRLREPSAEPLRVVLYARQPRKGGAIPVGPFAVFDVQPQHGTIEVRSRSDLRFRPVLRGEVVQRELTDEMRALGAVAAFTYWDLAAAGKTPGLVPAALALELETVRGAVEARATQTVQMLLADGEMPPAWRITTKLDLSPVRTSMDRLEIELPAGFQFDERVGVTPVDLVENPPEIREGPGPRRTLSLKLVQRQSRAVALDFVGHVLVEPSRTETVLELPRLTQVFGGTQGAAHPLLDRGGRLQVGLPPGLELLPRVLPAEVAPPRGTELAAWNLERLPTKVELAWQTRRAEAPARIVAEVVLGGTRAQVRQRLQFARPPRQVRLRVPASVQGPIRLADGREVRREGETSPAGSAWTAVIGPLKEDNVLLNYAVALPEPKLLLTEEGGAFDVPLLQPESGGEAKVLFWSDPDLRLTQAKGGWEAGPLEIGSDPDRLPDLVLRGDVAARLALHLHRIPAPLHSAIVVERVLVQVTLTETGTQLYRVRYLLSKLHGRRLDVELPVLPGRSGLSLRLDGKEMRRRHIDDAGREVEVSHTVRMDVEPELYRKPVVLEVSYTLSLSRAEGEASYFAVFRPPQLLGSVALGRTRWSMELTPGRVALHAGGAHVEHRWSWWGWLLAPRPAAGGEELDRWFAGPEGSPASEDNEPSLVCWQTALGPLMVLHVSQQAWLLVCSLTFLAVGLGLSFLPLPRTVFWGVTASLGVLIAAVSVLWPSVLPQIAYGCQPAALVLLLVVCVQWTLQQRYRRRLIFMPGFTRLKPGSSLIRGSSHGRMREPSTVDQQPGQRGSSLVRHEETGSQGS